MGIVPEEESRKFLQMRRKLFAFINSCVRDYHASEDILQGVWLSVLNAEQRGKKIEAFEPWCMKVARNQIAEYIRGLNDPRWKYCIDMEMLDLMERTFVEDVREEYSEGDRASALQRCMGKLSDKSREVLRLRYFENIDTDTLARTLGTSKDTLYVTLSRLRTWLRNCMEKSMKAGETA